ncbi:hypothetical protein KJ657_02005 [Patescibacteria group bacterium]|nr:hypothetical protein [Patescibacteria group bacterium]MBU1015842.1 hypothetical protein [Patescibacteria group bacterium]MBU1685288.1 hypothetical protein [Patescibacteria group bacterium]MBU1938485.1 hypothetical protein [Patescibacteria group bacterium]
MAHIAVVLLSLMAPVLIGFSDQSVWSFWKKYLIVFLIQLFIGGVIGFWVFDSFHGTQASGLMSLVLLYCINFSFFGISIFTLIRHFRSKEVKSIIVAANLGFLIVVLPIITFHVTGSGVFLDFYEKLTAFKLIGVTPKQVMLHLVSLLIFGFTFGFLSWFVTLIRRG